MNKARPLTPADSDSTPGNGYDDEAQLNLRVLN